MHEKMSLHTQRRGEDEGRTWRMVMERSGGKERSDGDGRRLTCAVGLEEEDGIV